MVKEKRANNSSNIEEVDSDDQGVNGQPICGIIMPIASTPGYPDRHWGDVYDILCEVASKANFNPRMVSFDDDIGVIHKRIVQNVYSNPIVICDISSRNANVMFELGMRLAFDKATIIVKDNQTPFSFDISAIEHLEYPSDLRYQSINDFKKKLEGKILETYRRSVEDAEYSTFLKQFGTFKVSKLDEREAGFNEVLLEEFKDLKKSIAMQLNKSSNSKITVGDNVGRWNKHEGNKNIYFKRPGIGNKGKSVLDMFLDLSDSSGIEIPSIRTMDENIIGLQFTVTPSDEEMEIIKSSIEKL
ncbi:hypothetical protein SMQE30_12900 [Serratia marcescens]|nr:hypothetical protein SMQE30_12900 [Serratia marcescens]